MQGLHLSLLSLAIALIMVLDLSEQDYRGKIYEPTKPGQPLSPW